MDATRYRWVVLAVGSTAQGATAACFLGLAAVAPDLRAHFGLSLAGVGTLIGVISVGLVATLIAWGGAADRFGERPVMTADCSGPGPRWAPPHWSPTRSRPARCCCSPGPPGPA